MAGKQKSSAKPRVDPELTRQLAEAPADSPVQAVFTLKTPAGERYRSAESTREAVGKIVDEACAAAKTQPQRVNVFANAQSFAISGPPALVRRLLEDGEIASAMANVQKEDLLIRPVKSKKGPK